ncbi:MAG TPA: Crp/Fnr family transcriptional regulator [Noviherbaspirillum sp.]
MTGEVNPLVAAQPILASLPDNVLAQLSAQSVISLPGGTRVFETSSACGGFPILLSGTVRVFKHLANGRRIELYRVTPNEPCILSLGCLLGGGQYPASGVTHGETRMIVMPPGLFRDCLASNDAFRTSIFKALGDRLVHTMELVEEVTTLRLDVRLAASLLAHAGSGGQAIAVTHQELADELGTVREMVSRVLDDFAHQGLVQLGRGRIQVTDPGRLRKLADTR